MADEDDIEDTGTSLLKTVYHDEDIDLESLLQFFNNPHLSSQTSEDLGSDMQPLRNVQSNSQTGVHLGSNMQPVSNLQSNSRTIEHIESNMQPVRNVQSSSQAGEHLGSNMQPLSNLQPSRTVEHIGSSVQPVRNQQSNSQAGEHLGSNIQPLSNLQFNSQTVEHIGSNVQPLKNLQSNSQAGEHFGSNMQPVRNQQFVSQAGEHLGYDMQTLRNRKSKIPTGSEPRRKKRKEASPYHNNYPPTEQPQQLVVSLPAATGTNCNVALAPSPANNILPSQSLLNPGYNQAPSYQLVPHFIPPNQAGISSQQRPRVQQQSVHMIPSIGNQQISAYPHSAGQRNSLSSSYQLQQSALPPMTYFSSASLQSSQGGKMEPYFWNTQERHDLVISEALTNMRFENLYQYNDLLKSELSDCKSYIGRLETEVNSLKQLQGQMDECKSQIRRLEAELYDWKQSQGKFANDMLCISAWKASEKSITGKPIPIDDSHGTLPSTDKANSHHGGSSASNVFLEKAFQDGRNIGDSYKLNEQNLLVQTGSDPSSTSGKIIKAGEEYKGAINVAAREGLPVTDVQRDEFTTELGIVQGEKEKAYTSVNGNTGDFPICDRNPSDEELEAFSGELLRLLES